jgi:hypothetical protein
MQYKIIGFNAANGSALVNFFTAEYPDGLTYNVDIPVENGSYISGDALRSYIMAFAPYGQIARIVELRDNPPNAAGIPTGDIIQPPDVKDPVLDATLPEAITYAEKAIDKGASAARSRFISSGVGQDAVYVVKGEQAQVYADAGFAGPVPSYIAAEAAATGVTEEVAAQTILALRDAWNNTVGPAIEALRIGGKKQARDATTVVAVDSAMRAALVALEAIRP